MEKRAMDVLSRSRRPLAVLGALIGALAPAPVLAEVTAVTLAPDKAVFHGDCPAKITFTGKVTVDGPGIVKYRFTRSDGATDSMTKTLKFVSAGSKPVSTTWTLGGPSKPNIDGWEAVQVISPTAIESAHANFN
jgi:hypothetical protein